MRNPTPKSTLSTTTSDPVNRIVLILAQREDTTADEVAAVLSSHPVEVVRLDTATFPQHLDLVAYPGSGRHGMLRFNTQHVDLTRVCSVYRRSPAFFEFVEGMSGPEERFAAMEAIQGFGGVLAALPCRWVNHPCRVADASYKPVQLHVAAACGLRVPPTLVTNVTAEAVAFANQVGGEVVYKPFSAGVVPETNRLRLVNTTRLSAQNLCHGSIALTAHMFQQWVPKVFDVRLTVVGERFFPVAIHAATEAAYVDWRSDYAALTYECIEIPDSLRRACQTFLDHFGLRFGAFDFSVTQDRTWWFLECNPNGAWGWVADATGLPIAEAIAAELAQEDPV